MLVLSSMNNLKKEELEMAGNKKYFPPKLAISGHKH
jgi:hypothetical protein